MPQEYILIVDFDSPQSRLIARCVRESNIYTETVSYKNFQKHIKVKAPTGIILADSENSVCTDQDKKLTKEIFNKGIPILGIGYGAHIMAQLLGGSVKAGDDKADSKESGGEKSTPLLVKSCNAGGELTNMFGQELCLIKHGDKISKMPKGFVCTVTCDEWEYAAMENGKKRLYAVQFNPEAPETAFGKQLLHNFVVKVCGCKQNWNSQSFIDEQVDNIRAAAQDKDLLCVVYGDLSSSVDAILASRAAGEKLTVVFIDHGFTHQNEEQATLDRLQMDFGIRILTIDAQGQFMAELSNKNTPSEKLATIDTELAKIISEKLNSMGDGCIYLCGAGGIAIKSGSNSQVQLELTQPLFEDELYKIAVTLGLQKSIVNTRKIARYGIALNVQGALTKEAIDTARRSDAVLCDEIAKAALTGVIRQYEATVLPSDSKDKNQSVIIKATTSADRVYSHWAKLPYDILEKISARIKAEIATVDKVLYDIS